MEGIDALLECATELSAAAALLEESAMESTAAAHGGSHSRKRARGDGGAEVIDVDSAAPAACVPRGDARYRTFAPSGPRTSLASWELPASVSESYAGRGLRTLYEWQAQALSVEGVLLDTISREPPPAVQTAAGAVVAPRLFTQPRWLLYCAPTSGGKSLVAEIIMLRRLLCDVTPAPALDSALRAPAAIPAGPAAAARPHPPPPPPPTRALIVMPFKALVDEKVAQLSRLLSPPGARRDERLRVVALHGGKRGADIGRARVIVCTSERALGLLNGMIADGSIARLRCVVIDELHMVSDASRGHAVEMLLATLLHCSRHGAPATTAPRAEPPRGRGAIPPAPVLLPRGATPSRVAVDVQVVGMSATLPNVAELATWLGAALYVTEFRPVPLTEFLLYDGVLYRVRENGVLCKPPAAGVARHTGGRAAGGGPLLADLEVVANYRTDAVKRHDGFRLITLCVETVRSKAQVLVFAATRGRVEVCAKNLAEVLPSRLAAAAGTDALVAGRASAAAAATRAQLIERLQRAAGDGGDGALATLKTCIAAGVGFHHGGLTGKQREVVELGFSRGALVVLVATSTLAAGVNLPARRVIFESPYVAMSLLSVGSYRQMAGRAGRAGRDTFGEAIMLCPGSSKTLQSVLQILRGDLLPASSALVSDELARELVAAGGLRELRMFEGEAAGLSSLVLQALATGVASTMRSLISLVRECTLLQVKLGAATGAAVASVVNFMLREHVCRCSGGWSLLPIDSDAELVLIELGRATVVARLSPADGKSLYDGLLRASHRLILQDPLHLLFVVAAPTSVVSGLDPPYWRERPESSYASIYSMQLPPSQCTIGELVGIEPTLLAEAASKKQWRKLEAGKQYFCRSNARNIQDEVAAERERARQLAAVAAAAATDSRPTVINIAAAGRGPTGTIAVAAPPTAARAAPVLPAAISPASRPTSVVTSSDVVVHRRFYYALILQALVSGVEPAQLAKSTGVPEVALPTLLELSSSFAAAVARFCAELRWPALEALAKLTRKRVSGSWSREIAFMRGLPGLTRLIAADLLDAGFDSLVKLADADPAEIEAVLARVSPFSLDVAVQSAAAVEAAAVATAARVDESTDGLPHTRDAGAGGDGGGRAPSPPRGPESKMTFGDTALAIVAAAGAKVRAQLRADGDRVNRFSRLIRGRAAPAAHAADNDAMAIDGGGAAAAAAPLTPNEGEAECSGVPLGYVLLDPEVVAEAHLDEADAARARARAARRAARVIRTEAAGQAAVAARPTAPPIACVATSLAAVLGEAPLAVKARPAGNAYLFDDDDDVMLSGGAVRPGSSDDDGDDGSSDDDGDGEGGVFAPQRHRGGRGPHPGGASSEDEDAQPAAPAAAELVAGLADPSDTDGDDSDDDAADSQFVGAGGGDLHGEDAIEGSEPLPAFLVSPPDHGDAEDAVIEARARFLMPAPLAVFVPPAGGEGDEPLVEVASDNTLTARRRRRLTPGGVGDGGVVAAYLGPVFMVEAPIVADVMHATAEDDGGVTAVLAAESRPTAITTCGAESSSPGLVRSVAAADAAAMQPRRIELLQLSEALLQWGGGADDVVLAVGAPPQPSPMAPPAAASAAATVLPAVSSAAGAAAAPAIALSDFSSLRKCSPSSAAARSVRGGADGDAAAGNEEERSGRLLHQGPRNDGAVMIGQPATDNAIASSAAAVQLSAAPPYVGAPSSAAVVGDAAEASPLRSGAELVRQSEDAAAAGLASDESSLRAIAQCRQRSALAVIVTTTRRPPYADPTRWAPLVLLHATAPATPPELSAAAVARAAAGQAAAAAPVLATASPAAALAAPSAGQQRAASPLDPVTDDFDGEIVTGIALAWGASPTTRMYVRLPPVLPPVPPSWCGPRSASFGQKRAEILCGRRRLVATTVAGDPQPERRARSAVERLPHDVLVRIMLFVGLRAARCDADDVGGFGAALAGGAAYDAAVAVIATGANEEVQCAQVPWTAKPRADARLAASLAHGRQTTRHGLAFNYAACVSRAWYAAYVAAARIVVQRVVLPRWRALRATLEACGPLKVLRPEGKRTMTLLARNGIALGGELFDIGVAHWLLAPYKGDEDGGEDGGGGGGAALAQVARARLTESALIRASTACASMRARLARLGTGRPTSSTTDSSPVGAPPGTYAAAPAGAAPSVATSATPAQASVTPSSRGRLSLPYLVLDACLLTRAGPAEAAATPTLRVDTALVARVASWAWRSSHAGTVAAGAASVGSRIDAVALDALYDARGFLVTETAAMHGYDAVRAAADLDAATVTFAVACVLGRALLDARLDGPARYVEMPLVRTLAGMERAGVGLEPGMLRRYKALTHERIAVVEAMAQTIVAPASAALAAAGDWHRGRALRSSAFIESVLYDTLGAARPDSRGSAAAAGDGRDAGAGEQSLTSRAALERVADPAAGAPPRAAFFAALVAEHRKLNALTVNLRELSNCVRDAAVASGFDAAGERAAHSLRAHAAFHTLTNTGRVTTVNPNLQNLPKEMAIARAGRQSLQEELDSRAGTVLFRRRIYGAGSALARPPTSGDTAIASVEHAVEELDVEDAIGRDPRCLVVAARPSLVATLQDARRRGEAPPRDDAAAGSVRATAIVTRVGSVVAVHYQRSAAEPAANAARVDAGLWRGDGGAAVTAGDAGLDPAALAYLRRGPDAIDCTARPLAAYWRACGFDYDAAGSVGGGGDRSGRDPEAVRQVSIRFGGATAAPPPPRAEAGAGVSSPLAGPDLTLEYPADRVFRIAAPLWYPPPRQHAAGGQDPHSVPTRVALRDAIAARAGYTLLSADYAQMEVRILAHLSGDAALCGTLSSEQDVFRCIAAAWLRRDAARVTPAERDKTKALVYGLLYGIGDRTLAANLGLADVDEARALSREFRETFRVATRFMRSVLVHCRRDGFVETLFRRRRYLPNINSSDVQAAAAAGRMAVNTACQGSAADVVKLAMSNVAHRLARLGGAAATGGGAVDSAAEPALPPPLPPLLPNGLRALPLPPARIVLQIHDELLCEVRDDLIDAAAAIVRGTMEGIVELTGVRLVVKLAAGRRWGTLAPLERASATS